MKKLSLIAWVLFAFQFLPFTSQAQQTYWVFLADKAGTTFDPYSYFDARLSSATIHVALTSTISATTPSIPPTSKVSAL